MSRGPRLRDLVSVVAELREELRRGEREIRNLRRENEVLREAAEPLIHYAPARERFAFILAHRDRFSVRLLCRVLITDRCNYHGWVRAEVKRCERAYDDQRLVELVVEVHTAHPVYGAPRVTHELKRQGIAVGQRRVARLMREHGIAGVTRRRRRNLSEPDSGAATVPDLLRREFSAPMPGLKLVGDITCFATGEGWLYLATAVDLCSKELIGYAIAPHMRSSLAVEAITAAHRTGLVAGNAIMRTDRGSQGGFNWSSQHLDQEVARWAMGRSRMRLAYTGGDPVPWTADGAVAESFFATIKAEIGTASWPDRASARRDIENWIKSYNERRLHSSLGYQTPVEARTSWQERISMAA